MPDSSTTCNECGAPLPESGDCWDRIAELLEREATVLHGGEEALRAHFFAVGTYMLQHPSRLTAAALDGLRHQMASMLTHPRPVAQLRDDVRRQTRGKKVAPDTPGQRSHVDPAWPRRWPVTAADVLARPPGEYIAAVRAWAESTIGALDAQVPSPAPGNHSAQSAV